MILKELLVRRLFAPPAPRGTQPCLRDKLF
jgi:hypothetical protein